MSQQQHTHIHTLPEMVIMRHEPQLLELLDAHAIVAVTAPTATGKTRFLPWMLFAKRHRSVRVAIPTTVAVRDAFRFVKEHCASDKLRVGFAAARQSHYSLSDDIVYATTGHLTALLIAMIKAAKPRKEIKAVLGDTLMVDEIHLQNKDTTMLLGLLIEVWPELGSSSRFLAAAASAAKRKTTSDGVTPPRLVFASATMDKAHLVALFGDFPTLQLPTTHHAIDDFYLSHSPSPKDVDEVIVRILMSEFERWRAEPDVTKRGHVLVFRPGQLEVESTLFALATAFPLDAPIVFYSAFSYLAPEEIDQIFTPSPDKLKVVVATNIAESSVTITDVATVIDDCWEKQAETSSTGGFKLSLVRVSQQAAVQRRGRTGRTMPGRCYRLCSADDFRTFQFDRTREIDRVPIYNEVLKLLDANLDPRRVLQISDQRFNQAMLMLLDLKLCDANRGGGDGDDVVGVTEEGRFVAQLQLGVLHAHMIYIAHERFVAASANCGDDATRLANEKLLFRSSLALAALLECYGPSYFFVPRREALETQHDYDARRAQHVREFHSETFGSTDIHTLMNLFWAEQTLIHDAQGKGKSESYLVREWSGRHSINHKKLREALALDGWLVRHFRSLLPDELADFHTVRCAHYLPGDEPVVQRDLPTLADAFSAAGLRTPAAAAAGAPSVVKAKKETKPLDIEIVGEHMATLFARAFARNRMVAETNKRGQIVDHPTYKSPVFNEKHKLSMHDMLSLAPRTPHASIVVAFITQLATQAGYILNLASVYVPGHYLPAEYRVQLHSLKDLRGLTIVRPDDDDEEEEDEEEEEGEEYDEEYYEEEEEEDDDDQAENDALVVETVKMMLAAQQQKRAPAASASASAQQQQQQQAHDQAMSRMLRALASLSLYDPASRDAPTVPARGRRRR